VARERLATMTAAMIAKGTPAPLAETKAIALLDGLVTRQALMISFERLFLLFGTAFLLALPLLLLMRKSRGFGGGGAH
jgi:DHA2 family multidrug resistance protein